MPKRSVAIILSVLILVAQTTSAPAQQPMQLTALDSIEIQQLVAKDARAPR